MSPEEAKLRLRLEPDFIFFPRYDNSLKKLKARYPDEAPDKVIAQALMLSDDEPNLILQKIVKACQKRVNHQRR